ncbi:hypothetical protein LEMA_P013470.1 [Plenodomus lingam JN3]|uniref:Uncharacterized protein n=1 Tax=Leptosphaeria maculans (strain JN3 / isolate v23.1.3 / race Av1-4-5-6-7-8) TaxID=985895 RepID=E5A976_LEPMJ|nr:hypothetical protein LEMA_P013470.1 [Plenodomus lingam JN3]CBY00217.1 hypothetical protein LEMA_P013470.1 [Plenodomus lingam JN3]
MAPNARTKAPAGRGRPKRAVAPAIALAPVANTTPAKRGRPAKAAEAVEVAAEPPKKRGRPPKKAETDVQAVVADMAVAPMSGKKSAGRGRPRKEKAPTTATKADSATPKHGRPAAKAAVNLNLVAGSPRVTKRTSLRTKKTAPKPSRAAAMSTSRLDPRIRSKLRTRLPASTKVAQEARAPQPTKRGRPKKVVAESSAPKKADVLKKTAVSKKSAGRKPGIVIVEKATKSPVVKPGKVGAPRKRRGLTTLEIPDKFAKAVQEFYKNLLAADADKSLATPLENGEGSAADDELADEAVEDAEEEEGHEGEAEGEEDVDLTSATAGAKGDVNDVATSSGSESEHDTDPQQGSSSPDPEQGLNRAFQAPQEQVSASSSEQHVSMPGQSSLAPTQLHSKQVVQREQTLEIDSAGNVMEEFEEGVVVYEGTNEFTRSLPDPTAKSMFAAAS